MIFGPVPVAEAEGTILAHSEQARGEAGTYKVAKGTVLDAGHIAALAAQGLEAVTVARLEEGDVHEDAAAARLAAALLGPDSGLDLSGAATGRVNLRAPRAGVVGIDADAIHRVNRINPGITIATVLPLTCLTARGLAATVKIIPYAVADADLAQACAAARNAMWLHRPVIQSATLIETQVNGDALPSDKGRRAIQGRLTRLGVALSDRVVVPHEDGAIAAALRNAPGELVMILTGSATSDSHDTAPAAVRRAGGDVAHYGMPVDPGNLLFIGKIGPHPVIGLPGCARSPALNGADWVLERVICGVPVTSDDIASMGVGGLLKEIPSRPVPRAQIEA